MVISFTDDTAFEQLRDEGYVATFRTTQRKQTGETWANRGRLMTKEFDVKIVELGVVDTSSPAFSRLAPISGFGDAVTWRGAIERINGEVPNDGWVYHVSRQD